MAMALGDALAVALLRDRGFSAADFHGFHPGGNLGAALRRVRDLMHGIDATPLCPETATLKDAVAVLNKGGFGCVGLIDDQGDLTGILTDGDLRRAFHKATNAMPASEVMTKAPITVTADALAGDALALLSRDKITAVIVVDGKRPIGILHVHDCLSTGVL